MNKNSAYDNKAFVWPVRPAYYWDYLSQGRFAILMDKNWYYISLVENNGSNLTLKPYLAS